MRNPTQKLAILGASGQLGTTFKVLSAQYPKFSFQFLDKNALDITNKNEVATFFADNQLDYCINCAAYTAVDQAEKEEFFATKVNKDAIGNIAKVAFENGVNCIHFSTDYVYADIQNQPIKEDAPKGPTTIYGKTKLEGEIKAIENNPNTLIIRTSWVYSAYGKNFLKTMIRLGHQRDRLKCSIRSNWLPYLHRRFGFLRFEDY